MEGGAGAGRGAREERTANMDIAKPQLFDGTSSKVSGFVIRCKLYIKNKLAGATVEEQVQWVLSHVQGGSANIWKENVLEDLKEEAIEYESVGEFLMELKKEFGGRDKEAVKVAELKKLEQGGEIMEEFVQEFKRAIRGSRYKEHPLIKEFKRGINGVIRRKLMEVENQPGSIEQWFRRATALD